LQQTGQRVKLSKRIIKVRPYSG